MIERPASVVKELLENAVDAKASQIKIDINNAGNQLIRIQDNGVGIHKEDLSKAIARHGTSKIAQQVDLSHINTLGFRGEALASIAAIAEMTIASCAENANHAWQIKIKGVDSEIATEPLSHPVGTTVSVYDLFASTPARKKFLKTTKTEFFHIEEMIRRIALAHFKIRFEFNHNQKQIFLLPQAQDELAQEKRVAKLLHKDFLQHAMKIQAQTQDLQISGWVANENFSRASTDMQYVFINGRYVKDKVIQHAIKQAFQNLTLTNRYPAFVVYLTLKPEWFDVNVHPTKHEVRFYESRLIHDFVYQCLKQSLNATRTEPMTISPEQNATETEKNYVSAATSEQTNIKPNVTKIPTRDYQIPQPIHKAQQMAQKVAQTQAFYQTTTTKTAASDLTPTNKVEPPGRYIGQLAQQYLLYETKQGLKFIDAKRIESFIAEEKYQHEIQSKTIKQQALIMPLRLSLTPKQTQQIQDLTCLQTYGLNIEYITSQTLVLRKIPKVFAKVNWQTCLQQLFNDWEKFQRLETKAQQIYLATLFAKHYQLASIDADATLYLLKQYPELLSSKKIICTKLVSWAELR